MKLDTHVPGSAAAAGPVSTATPLVAGAHYDVIVAGTMSIWAASQWSAPGTQCGASEELPMFPSPETVNGPTGWDAETVFAVPPGVDFYNFSCEPSQIPFQSTKHSPGGFQVSVSGAKGFSHVAPLGGERSTPTVDHTYTYGVTGAGQPASFRFVDEPVADDYGVFMIKVLTAAECSAINCEGSAAAIEDQTVSPAANGKGEVRGTSLVKLPASGCLSRRSFPIHFRIPRGLKVATIAELVNGHTVHSFTAKTAAHVVKAGVDMRGFPAGTFTFEVRVTTTRGQVLRTIRTYHTCKPSKKHSRS
ncbi:MAG TPA: hypothetical protein VIJ39_09185 [Solirubrobacteraceae bacterium]